MVWQVDISVPFDHAAHILDAWETDILSGSCFESVENPEQWVVSLLFSQEPDRDTIRERLISCTPSYPTQDHTSHISIVLLPEKDWIIESQRYFVPMFVGEFCIHTSWHSCEMIPDTLYPLMIDPSQAFGTGTHETTQGCLLALTDLADSGFMPKRILDMGTGSGILAIASRYLWPNAQVVAADYDMKAVDIARQNIELVQGNTSTLPIPVIQADCFNHRDLIAYAPYDLVLANILAVPLINMAAQLPSILNHHNISVRPKIILSGFYQWQSEEVLSAYGTVSLALEQEHIQNQWCTVTLTGS